MRFFVTGSTGFVGGYLVPLLVDGGHEVTCLVRDPGRGRGLPPAAVLLEGDVTRPESYRHRLPGHDCLIHLANLYSLWEPDPSVYRAVNVEGTRLLFEAALEASVPKVVHISSVAVYGCQDEPFEEDATSGECYSTYAESKAEGDRVAWELFSRGLPLVILYPGVILGPGDPKASGRMVSDLVGRRMPALLCPNSFMTYVDVRDVAEAILLAAEKEGNLGERYLVGKHQATTRELAQLIAKKAGVPLPRLTLPDPVAAGLAALLTRYADLTKRPPAWGLSADMVRSMTAGFRFCGSKAERELGLTYTPLDQTVEDAVTHLAALGAAS